MDPMEMNILDDNNNNNNHNNNNKRLFKALHKATCNVITRIDANDYSTVDGSEMRREFTSSILVVFYPMDLPGFYI